MPGTLNNDWGIFGLSAAVVGVISFFIPGFSALFIGLLAVILGFLGAKKQQRLSTVGLLIGGVVVFYANIVNMGIIPMHHYVHSDRIHFINSLNGNIAAFNAMKGGENRDSGHRNILKHLEYSLDEAGKVDIESLDCQVEDFSSHYNDNFIQGTEFLHDGIENSDISLKLKGGVLLDKWGVWSQANNDNLKKIKEPNSLSLFSFLYVIVR